jgi:hypothetical protein
MILSAKHFYDTLDENWPGEILDTLRIAVESGMTNDQIIGILEFPTPPEKEYLGGIRAALDYIRSQP